ncbi:hypothetical protein ABIA24_006724 [Sinorhizobium fredii]|uniref:hypothetical protein n=1 Tax=Rhizobium fredii TaxID=380 RepID=UPI0035144560
MRAELAASIDAGERQQIAAELERAIAQHQQEEAAFDALISATSPAFCSPSRRRNASAPRRYCFIFF